MTTTTVRYIHKSLPRTVIRIPVDRLSCSIFREHQPDPPWGEWPSRPEGFRDTEITSNVCNIKFGVSKAEAKVLYCVRMLNRHL